MATFAVDIIGQLVSTRFYDDKYEDDLERELLEGRGLHSSISQLNIGNLRVPHASAFRLDVSTFLGLFGEFHRPKTSQVGLRSGR